MLSCTCNLQIPAYIQPWQRQSYINDVYDNQDIYYDDGYSRTDMHNTSYKAQTPQSKVTSQRQLITPESMTKALEEVNAAQNQANTASLTEFNKNPLFETNTDLQQYTDTSIPPPNTTEVMQIPGQNKVPAVAQPPGSSNNEQMTPRASDQNINLTQITETTQNYNS